MSEKDLTTEVGSISLEHYELWRYWISVENRLIETDQYCSIHEDNKKCFSREYAQIILLSSVHFESCAKRLVLMLGGNDDNIANAGQIREFLITKFPGMPRLQLSLFPSMKVLEPLKEWADGKKTEWWNQYTSIKHDFEASQNLATQEVAINALAGCLAVLLYLFQGSVKQIHPHSSLILYDRPKFVVLGGDLKLP